MASYDNAQWPDNPAVRRAKALGVLIILAFVVVVVIAVAGLAMRAGVL